ncbi:MAG: outer membrane protein transport protein [Myxococcota bacterium]|nr:outer membrane protein transport protein [Myxococcota bacterium]MDW8362177.1 outer membrane protein transport protein [Myxococcales bacterium]
MTRTGAIRVRLVVAATVAWGSAARAQTGVPFGDEPRSAALAGSGLAGPAGLDSVDRNPGALHTLERPVAALWAHGGSLRWWFARRGEPRDTQTRFVGGFGVALVAPWPGDGPLRTVRLGVGLHVPFEHALSVDAPPRDDVPSLALYENRAERMAVTVGGALALLDGAIGLGAAIRFVPSLRTPTRVRYDPGSSERRPRVLIDLERELPVGLAPVVGVAAQPLRALHVGLVYRGRAVMRAEGSNDTRAGGIRLDDPIDFAAFVEPDVLAFGVSWQPVAALRVQADAGWARWSRFVTIHDRRPDPPWRDMIEARAGVEIDIVRSITLRAGLAYEPTPVPPQRRVSNFVDADRLLVTAGAGIGLEALGLGRARLELYGAWLAMATARAHKDLDALPDDDAQTPGRQIRNLGAPAWSGSATAWQAGLGLTLPLGRDPWPADDDEASR